MRQYIDFLSAQAPYDRLDAEDLALLARHIEVEYFPTNTEIVAADGPVLHHLYVIRKGAVEVFDRGRVVDQLGPGDTFGHISVLSGLPPPFAVRAAEDTLVYRLPDPRGLLRYPDRLHFSHYGSTVARTRLTSNTLVKPGQQPLDTAMRPILWCAPSSTIRDAAALMTEHHQSCVVLEAPTGLGIITDSDIRRCVGTGDPPLTSSTASLATTPALTVPLRTSRDHAFTTMIEHGVHHLVVVDDDERATGIVRVIDLASADLRDPLRIRAAIEAARSLKELAQAAQALPATAVGLAAVCLPGMQTGSLLAAVRESVLQRLLQIVDDSDHTWLLLGSTARREPLPSSDLNTAITWEDSAHEGHDAAYKRARSHARRVLDELERCGLARCPSGANATDPRFCRSAQGWRRASNDWQRRPLTQDPMLLTAVLADARPIAGSVRGRGVDAPTQNGRPSVDLLAALLGWAVSLKPPQGFVRDIVVEHSGEHRDGLDLKRSGLAPIAALGQWIAVATGDRRGSTPERLRRGHDVGILTKDEAESLEGAFAVFYQLLFEADTEALRTGLPPSRHVHPASVDPSTRRHLRAAFREVARVQAHLASGWKGRLP